MDSSPGAEVMSDVDANLEPGRQPGVNPASTRARLTLLGDLRLDGAEGELLHRRRKDLALLAWLGCRRTPVRREELAALFWGDRDDSHARQSLRQAIASVRKALPDAILLEGETVALAPDAVAIDVIEFEAQLGAGRLADAVELWKGDLLPSAEDLGTEAFRDWLEVERPRLRSRLGTALERLTVSAPAIGDQVRWSERWAEFFPLDERAHVHLLAAFERAGRVEEALERHAAFVARHSVATGRDLSQAVREMVEVLHRAPRNSRAHQPGSAAFFTPDLIGRDAELSALEAAWAAARTASGVVALIEGEPGAGRTRICRELLRFVTRSGHAVVLESPRACDDAAADPVREFLAPLEHAPSVGASPPWALGELAVTLPGLRNGRSLPPPERGDRAAAAYEVIATVAEEAPLLVLVDDAATACVALRPIVARLIRKPPPSVLVVLTAIPGRLGDSELGRALRESPDTRRIKLRPLDASQVEVMIASMVPIAAADRQRLTALLHAETGGNPLQVSDCISAFADAGVLSLDQNGLWRFSKGRGPASLPLPASLARTRLDQLSPGASATIQSAARLRARVEGKELLQATGLSDEESESALGELVTRRLLRPVRDGSTYEFTSDAVRKLVADSLPATEMTKPRALRPAWRWAAVACVGAIGLALAALVPRSAPAASGAASADRMIVFPFQNATGDPAFDEIGRRAADRITLGIAGLGRIPVAPGPRSAPRDPVALRAVAQSAQATLAIGGSIRRSGDSVAFNANLIDIRSGAVSAALEPVRASALAPQAAIELLEDRILGLVAARLDPRTAEAASLGSVPAKLAAYRAMSEGLDRFYAREGGGEQMREAFAIDSTFTLPLVYLALQHIGDWRWTSLDSVIDRFGARPTLPAFEQSVLGFLRAYRSGDLAARYAAARRATELAPHSIIAVLHYPAAAIALNRPREAVELLDRVDPVRDAFDLPAYWSTMSAALHGAGEYRRQLEVGNLVAHRLPNDRRGAFYQVRALAALSQLDSLEEVLAEGFMLRGGPRQDAAGLALHLVAFDELRAHGFSARATEVLSRAVAFYQGAPDSVQQIPRQRLVLATAFLRLGRVGEARQLLAQVEREGSLAGYNAVVLKGTIGIAAGMDGDSAAASAAARELAANPYPMYAVSTLYRARIAAVQGHRAEALRLLRQGVTEGMPHDITNHSDFVLSYLRGYPPFEEWVKPKG